jgi:4-amino-4-deoxy-L-arabinose transferase-like glycosyltransferase
MIKWPRSKGVQVTIAFLVALFSAAFVVAQIAMESFNHYYFPPHKAYPYPYATAWDAQMAMCRDCGLTFVIVFAILLVAQRKFTAARHTKDSK